MVNATSRAIATLAIASMLASGLTSHPAINAGPPGSSTAKGKATAKAKPPSVEPETEVEIQKEAEVDDDPDFDDGITFGFSIPVICSEVAGYNDFVVRDNSALTKDEKLLLYFEPRHFKSEKVGKKQRAHFTQDVKVRRKGQKNAVWSKEKLGEYKLLTDGPPQFVFLRSSISLKPFKPGDYELELTLHDLIGRSAPGRRTIPFKIVESTNTALENDGEPEKSGSR